MMWIVKIPKVYRINNDMAKFVGPFSSSKEAMKWVAATFKDYETQMFSCTRVDKPL